MLPFTLVTFLLASGLGAAGSRADVQSLIIHGEIGRRMNEQLRRARGATPSAMRVSDDRLASGAADAQSSSTAGPTRVFRLDSLPGLELRNVTADVVTYRGRRALHLLETPGIRPPEWQGRGHAMAILADSDFENGVIEVELAGAPKAGAGQGARGFVGIAFRVTPHASGFESFYLRPTNGRADDQLRRNHATQYISWPDHPWERLRAETPGVYESYVDLEPGVWTTMRIVVSGSKAQLYVHGAAQPTLIVNDLKRGAARGKIALWLGQDTEAHFAKLTATPM